MAAVWGWKEQVLAEHGCAGCAAAPCSPLCSIEAAQVAGGRLLLVCVLCFPPAPLAQMLLLPCAHPLQVSYLESLGIPTKSVENMASINKQVPARGERVRGGAGRGPARRQRETSGHLPLPRGHRTLNRPLCPRPSCVLHADPGAAGCKAAGCSGVRAAARRQRCVGWRAVACGVPPWALWCRRVWPPPALSWLAYALHAFAAPHSPPPACTILFPAGKTLVTLLEAHPALLTYYVSADGKHLEKGASRASADVQELNGRRVAGASYWREGASFASAPVAPYKPSGL